jgi:hypothetical protein
MHKLIPADMRPSAGQQQRSDALARLTLYLQALDLPPSEIQRLSAQALEMAAASAPTPLLPAAMEALQILLDEVALPQPPAVRPIRRRSMVPEPLERSLIGMAALAIAVLGGRPGG